MRWLILLLFGLCCGGDGLLSLDLLALALLLVIIIGHLLLLRPVSALHLSGSCKRQLGTHLGLFNLDLFKFRAVQFLRYEGIAQFDFEGG